MKCVDCFATLELEEIDWTGVAPDTECKDVVDFLQAGGHCQRLGNDKGAVEIFCNTFNSCVVWEVEGTDDDEVPAPEDDKDWVNCTALTECDWPGIKKTWLGDSICQNNMHGCYNTAICGWDGGDCCEDTCVNDSTMKECGHDGYACRDPNSDDCDSDLTSKCKTDSSKNGKADPSSVTCSSEEQKYRLNMFDSFGDGWDITKLTITPSGSKKKVFEGALKDGSEGTEYICLSKEPSCYNVMTTGGTWGLEVSWDIKPLKEGSPSSKSSIVLLRKISNLIKKSCVFVRCLVCSGR